MKKMLALLLLSALTVLACPTGKMCGTGGCESKKAGSPLGTLYYALEKMGKTEDAQIKMALSSYKMQRSSLKRGMDTEAFKGAKFDKELYAKNSRLNKKLQAQITLFERVFAVLDEKEKTRLNTLMSAHQHQMKILRTQGMQGKMCPKGKMKCSGKAGCACPKCTSAMACSDKPDCACPHCKGSMKCSQKADCACPKCAGKMKCSSMKDCQCPKCKGK